MRHRHHQHRRNCKHSLERNTPVEVDSSPVPELAPTVQVPEPVPASDPVHGDIEHFQRLARVQGIEAAAKAYTKEELTKMARINGFTYLNPRARKIDLAHALLGIL